jgi:hypothetical protein
MRKITLETTDNTCTDDTAGLMAVSSSLETLSFESEPESFAEYTQKVISLNRIHSDLFFDF